MLSIPCFREARQTYYQARLYLKKDIPGKNMQGRDYTVAVIPCDEEATSKKCRLTKLYQKGITAAIFLPAGEWPFITDI